MIYQNLTKDIYLKVNTKQTNSSQQDWGSDKKFINKEKLRFETLIAKFCWTVKGKRNGYRDTKRKEKLSLLAHNILKTKGSNKSSSVS